VAAEPARSQAVHSGGSGVARHRLQGSEQVASFEHRLDEVRLSGIGWFSGSRRVCAGGLPRSQLPAGAVQVSFRYFNSAFLALRLSSGSKVSVPVFLFNPSAQGRAYYGLG
jgi:hypothetical protein